MPLHPLRAALLAACLLLSGCDADVIPLVDADRHFSLYGVVNPRADSQSVVVFPIEDTLRPLPDAPLDATVTSTDLETGETVVWRDSVVTSAEGAVHVFWAPFRAAYGHTYRIVVAGADGDVSSATVAVPPEADLVVVPAEPTSPPRQAVRVTAPVDRLNRVLVSYLISARVPPAAFSLAPTAPPRPSLPGFEPPAGDPPEADSSDGLVVQRVTAFFDYGPQAVKEADGWHIDIALSADFRKIRDAVRGFGRYDLTYGIRLDSMEIRMIAANAEWDPPDGVFNPEQLVQPGTLSNVVQGFGFVGAGYRLEARWLPTPDVLRIAGFTIPPGS